MWLGGRLKRAKFIFYRGKSKDNVQTEKLTNNNTNMLNGNIQANNKRSKKEEEKGLPGMAVLHDWLCRTVWLVSHVPYITLIKIKTTFKK